MPRQEPDRTKDFCKEFFRVGRKRRHQPPVCIAIVAEPRGGLVDRQFHHRGSAVVERMRDCERRFTPFQSMLGQRQRLKKRRDEAHRMDGRTHIMPEPRQRQLLGACAAADGFFRLEHEDAAPRAREHDRGGKSVGARADDDCIEFSHEIHFTTETQRSQSFSLCALCLCGSAHYTAREMPTLDDESPQARRIAAIALGKRGGAGAVAALRDALAREELGWVRASMILALGKIGGDEARAVLAGIEARSDAEAEGLRKARDRVSGPAVGFSWRGDSPIFASVPVGLEDVAIDEAGNATFVRCGIIALSSRPRGLRCIYDVRLLIAEVAAGAFAETARKADVRWRDCISSASDVLPYRFSLENVRVAKQEFNELLRLARETFSPQGLVDSPSSYAAMLRIEADADATRMWLVPTFDPDTRFAYRLSDVGASINPVVGACLARLVRRGDRSAVVDPTCGSGTLLIERAMLDTGTTLSGIDISPTAIRAATGNIVAAGLAARIAVRQGDGGDTAAWPDRCDEVLANLPFGMRTEDRNLDGLYRRIVGNIARTANPGGRALLYTTHAKTLIALLRRTAKLKVMEERRVESGGMEVGVWVVERA